ncbi:MAG: hypothetical protein ACREP1_08550, partial [Rhodanobacteraceae bacterium]
AAAAIVILALCFGVSLMSHAGARNRTAYLATLAQEDDALRPAIAAPGFIPASGERLLYGNTADCSLPTQIERSVGSYGGLTIGAFSTGDITATTASKTQLQHIGPGVLMITNKRVVVMSANEIRQWAIPEIVSFTLLRLAITDERAPTGRLILHVANIGRAEFELRAARASEDAIRLALTGEA